MIKFSLPLIPARIGNTIVNQSDRYFIRYFISISDTGIYSLAQKLGTAIHSFITVSFQSVFGPRRFEIAHRDDAAKMFSKIFVYHALVLIFVGLSIAIFIPEILELMVSAEFYAAAQFVPLIILAMILFGLRNHFEFGILWSKKTKYYAYINSIMVFINLILNFAFIYNFGIWGAAVSEILCVILHNCLIYYFAQKQYFIKFEFLRVIKAFLLGILFYFLSILINSPYLITNIVAKLLLVFLFIISAFMTNIVTKNEKTILSHFLYKNVIVRIHF
jgi:O-antigen/teichoic acid export membrane protein